MNIRNLNAVMQEGRDKTIEQMELLKKQMAGTITDGETVRLNMLTGNLLALVDEAKGMGFNPFNDGVEEDSEEDWENYGIDDFEEI